ncbi:MAG: PilZ domain-containing protein [Desulfobulbaceae bacterium]|nr:PilZ domain-containing protein [Desulfobulbaceae bacterium]
MTERECRGSARRDTLNLLDYIILDESGQEVDRAMARTLNVSEKGILLETHLPLAPGQKLLITIGLRNKLFEFKGRVAHSEACATESHCSGIEFIDVSPEGLATLQEFLAAFNAQTNQG